MAEQAWRPRPCVTRTGGPGRLGFPSGPTTRVCLQWLHGERNEGGESQPGHVRVDPSGPLPEERSRGGRRHTWSAGGRRARKARGTFYEVQTKT
jgi:hypothetical protein